MIFVLPFVLGIVAVKATPLVIKELPLEDGSVYLSEFGVDLRFCGTLLYQVKACEDHGVRMSNDDGQVVFDWKISSWYNGKTRLHNNLPEFRYVDAGFPNLLSCDEFRWLWMKWTDGRIKFGRGAEPEVNTMIEDEATAGKDVTKMSLFVINGVYNVSVRYGEEGKDRFARVLEEGKFTDGLISESSISRKSCSSLCSDHVDCGMFSYNNDLGLCAIFDRMTSSFGLTSEVGWVSWKMLYCYP